MVLPPLLQIKTKIKITMKHLIRWVLLLLPFGAVDDMNDWIGPLGGLVAQRMQEVGDNKSLSGEPRYLKDYPLP